MAKPPNINALAARSMLLGALFDNKRPDELPRGAATESADLPDETYSDGLIAAEAIRRMQAAKNEQQPFFLAVGFLKPHLDSGCPQILLQKICVVLNLWEALSLFPLRFGMPTDSAPKNLWSS